jgi:hypothetical protein
MFKLLESLATPTREYLQIIESLENPRIQLNPWLGALTETYDNGVSLKA